MVLGFLEQERSMLKCRWKQREIHTNPDSPTTACKVFGLGVGMGPPTFPHQSGLVLSPNYQVVTTERVLGVQLLNCARHLGVQLLS